MVNGHPKPRYSEQMENGVLYFVPGEKRIVIDMGVGCGNKLHY
jgi:hypothetical protein